MTSREYVRGVWLGIFGRIILIGLISWIINAIISLAFSGFSEEITSLAATIITTLVVVPYVTIYTVDLYKNAKERRGEITELPNSFKYATVSIAGWIIIPVSY